MQVMIDQVQKVHQDIDGNMAQKIIRLGFPKAAQEYKAGQLDQLVNTLEQMILQLYNTFSNNIPEENAEQQGWFFK